VVYHKIDIRFSLSFLKGEGVPNYYAIKAKEVSPEILSTSTKPYYIPFHNRSKIKVKLRLNLFYIYIIYISFM